MRFGYHSGFHAATRRWCRLASKRGEKLPENCEMQNAATANAIGTRNATVHGAWSENRTRLTVIPANATIEAVDSTKRCRLR